MSDDHAARGSSAHLSTEVSEHGSPAGCLVRLTWLLLGPAALFFCAALVADGRGPHRLTTDLAFFGVAAAMVALRYLDVTHLDGQRANGEQATPDDFRRYALLVTVTSALVWGAATWIRL